MIRSLPVFLALILCSTYLPGAATAAPGTPVWSNTNLWSMSLVTVNNATGNVFVVLNVSNKQSVACLNGSSGVVLWSAAVVSMQLFPSNTIVGIHSGNYGAYVTSKTQLAAFNLNSGALEWNVSIKHCLPANSVFVTETLVFPSYPVLAVGCGNYVRMIRYGYYLTGLEWLSIYPVTQLLFLSDINQLIVGTQSNIAALSLTTTSDFFKLNLTWMLDVSSQSHYSSVAYGDRKLFFTCWNTNGFALNAIDALSSAMLWSSKINALSLPEVSFINHVVVVSSPMGSVSSSLTAFDSFSGAGIWTSDFNNATFAGGHHSFACGFSTFENSVTFAEINVFNGDTNILDNGIPWPTCNVIYSPPAAAEGSKQPYVLWVTPYELSAYSV